MIEGDAEPRVVHGISPFFAMAEGRAGAPVTRENALRGEIPHLVRPPGPVRRARRRRRQGISVGIAISYPYSAIKPSNGAWRDRSQESLPRGWLVSEGCRELPERESALGSLEIQSLDRGGNARIGREARGTRRPWRWTGPSAYGGRRRPFAPGEWSPEHGFCLNAPVHPGGGRGGRISDEVRRRSVRVREALDGGWKARPGGFVTRRPEGHPWNLNPS